MNRRKQLIEEAAAIRDAENAAKKLLRKKPTRDEFAKIGAIVHRLAKEHLGEVLEEGCVSHHVTEAYQGKCLIACFGSDIYKIIGKLGGEG